MLIKSRFQGDNKMNASGIIEVTKILIGETEPYGSSHVDTIRFDNQEKLIELTNELLDILIKNSKCKDRSEYSMQKTDSGSYFSIFERIHRYHLLS